MHIGHKGNESKGPELTGANRLRGAADTVFDAGYFLSYLFGALVIFWLRRGLRGAMRPLRWLADLIRRGWERLVLRPAGNLAAEGRRVKEGFSIASSRLQAARKRNLFLWLLQVLALPFMAIKRHRKALARVGGVLLPVAAALVLVFTLQYWSNLSFGLTLEYGGERLGVISDESVFDSAAAMVNSQVKAPQSDAPQVRTPSLTLSVVAGEEVLDEEAVRDKLISASSDEFVQATGLYVDGDLVGALPSAEEVDAVLDSMLAVYREKDRTVEFVQQVDREEGLYPLSVLLSSEGLRDRLEKADTLSFAYTALEEDTLSSVAEKYGIAPEVLCDLNRLEETEPLTAGQQLLIRVNRPLLQVRAICVREFEEPIPYETVTETDPEMLEGERTVKVQGEEGVRAVVERTVYLSGKVLAVERTSETVTRQPKAAVVTVGTKKRAPVSVYTPGVSVRDGDGQVTGQMMWPVPAVHSMSRGYRAGHQALDICNGPVTMMGAQIVAADGGVAMVVSTNPYQSYGIHVIIDHGNGIHTLYAHLSSVSVVQGQPVTKGQELGRGGMTGNATGPHLHFEVRVNGVRVNPMNYVTP